MINKLTADDHILAYSWGGEGIAFTCFNPAEDSGTMLKAHGKLKVPYFNYVMTESPCLILGAAYCMAALMHSLWSKLCIAPCCSNNPLFSLFS